MRRYCLFCGPRAVSFKRVEHIIPESLGNTTFILTGVVCDKCNQYFSKLEEYFVHHYPTSPARLLTVQKTKKGKLPLQKLHQGEFKREKEGHLTFKQAVISGKEVDQLSLTFRADSVVMKASFPLPDSDAKKLSRFLAKVGLETLYFKRDEMAFAEEFDPIRKYARFGDGMAFVPFLWGEQRERQIDLLLATVSVRSHPGTFYFSTVFVPGSVYFVPLNQISQTVAIDKIASKYALNKVTQPGIIKRDPPRIEVVWGPKNTAD
jgi:hypothetical protein